MAKTVDELSAEDRKVVVSALSLKHTSLLRAAKSASSDAVAKAYEAEAVAVGVLLNRFR